MLLRPSLSAEGNLKYDMRVVAQSVEYYACMKDQPFLASPPPPDGLAPGGPTDNLRNSLWVLDGGELKAWTEVQDVLQVISGGDLPPAVTVTADFYPLSVLLGKGIVLGVEPDLVQRRDVGFSFFRFSITVGLTYTALVISSSSLTDMFWPTPSL